uniref:Uncharacterized protein n=1 Tax=Tanacetum cinerariifolium TaxID=118510 RepID=A0A699GRU7_TANCI|nr:hypothetical protein [Tanacetum cinerariifolium]
MKVNELRAERLARTHDLLALMANSNNPYKYIVFHQDQPSQVTYMQQPQPNNNYIPQPSFNQNYMQQPRLNPKDISDPTIAMNMTLAYCLTGYEFGSRQINAMQMIRGNDGNQFRQYAGQNVGNQNRIDNQNVNHHGNGNVVPSGAKGNGTSNANNGDLEEIEEVDANCILMANLQQASTSGTQTNKAPVYDLDGSAEVYEYDNCYNNEIFNMFTQEEQYTELLEPISEPHQVQQNDNNVISAIFSLEQNGGTVEQNLATDAEKRAYFESLYNNLAIKKMALGYQNPFYLKQAQQRQQSLYNGKVLLEKHDPPAVYDSEETIQRKENGENILKSIDEGPFKMRKFRETFVEGAEGALHLGQNGIEFLLTLHQKKRRGETIHEYYVRFTKLINDMRNIKMTMPKMQVNSKFVNNMLHEYGRFVTTVKLNRGLKTSNYDQLYAYLKQHETHANKNKMMLERYTQHAIDLLALVFNVSLPQYPTQSSAIPQFADVPLVTYPPQFADNTHLDLGLTSIDDLIENLTKTVALLCVQGRQNRGQGNNARGAVAAGNRGFQNRVGDVNPGQTKPIKCYNYNRIRHIARQCTHPKSPHNSKYFKDKMLLMQAQENEVVLDEEQLLFIVVDQCDAFDFDVDEAPTVHTMFRENLSSADPIYDDVGPSYDSDILSEVRDHDNYIDSVCEYHEVHKMQNEVQINYIVDSDAEYTSDSNIILYEQYVKDNAVQVVQSNVSSVPNDALMMIINDMHEQAAQCVFAN